MTTRTLRGAGSPCRVCRASKPARWYLCRDCWTQVPDPARRALNRRDDRALARLRELHAHIDNGLPLTQVEITP